MTSRHNRRAIHERRMETPGYFSQTNNNMPNMKVYAITIEDTHGEYRRLYALADNTPDRLRFEEMAQAEAMGDDMEICVREIELNIPIKN